MSRTILTFLIAHNLTFTKKSIAQFTFGSWASFNMQYNFLSCHNLNTCIYWVMKYRQTISETWFDVPIIPVLGRLRQQNYRIFFFTSKWVTVHLFLSLFYLMLAIGLLQISYVRYVPCIPNLSRTFTMKKCWFFF